MDERDEQAKMAPPPSFWTAERVSELRRMHAAGKTASEIMAALGATTRNTVIGKISRLGLVRHNRPVKVKPVPPPSPPKPPRPTKPPHPSPVAPPPAGTWAPLPGRRPKPLRKLTDASCRWPLWDSGPTPKLYCGAPGADLEAWQPYCPVHAAIAFRKRPGE